MSAPRCEICGISVNESALYRNGPKGQIVPWRCWPHVDPQWRPKQSVAELSEMISDANNKRRDSR